MSNYSNSIKGNEAGRRSVEMLQNVRVFVSYPSDVAKEREHLRNVADKINQSIAHELGFHLEVVDWKTHVIPEMGERPQAIINKQIGSYDIFVGIMWKRFGTPTGEAEILPLNAVKSLVSPISCFILIEKKSHCQMTKRI
jgi:hypothetical protein